MKIATWNAHQGVHDKLGWLFDEFEFELDIAVLQECARPELLVKRGLDLRGFESAWTGFDDNAGVGVFSRNGWTVDIVAPAPPAHAVVERFIARRAEVELRVLAVWADNSKNARPARDAVRANGDWLRGERAIVLGDFNDGVYWNPTNPELNFRTVIDELGALGLQAVCESDQGATGAGETPTLWMQFDQTRPYHVDHVFVSKALAGDVGLRIATWDELTNLEDVQRSDHAPLVATLDDSRF